jgi:molecular chaperone GrpE
MATDARDSATNAAARTDDPERTGSGAPETLEPKDGDETPTEESLDQVPDAGVSDPTAPDPVVELQARLDEATAKAEDNWDSFVRAKAEIENVRRRAERDVQSAHKFAVEKLINEILPVRDSLEMGIAAAREDGAEIEKLLEGSDLTLKMLTGTLAKFGVEEVDPTGEKFNPELHEAMAMQPSTVAEPNTVLQVIQKGYRLHDRVIRPAMVIVAKAG